MDLLTALNDLTDSRREQSIIYPMNEVVFVSILAAIANANSYRDMNLFAKMKLENLRENYEIEWKEAPSYTGMRKILLKVDENELEKVLLKHAKEFLSLFDIEWLDIALDGKSVRGSYDKGKEEKCSHFLVAFAQEFKLIIAQRSVTEEKTNEIPIAQKVIPELIRELPEYELRFTADPMHCQKNTISIKDGEFLLQVKGNQPTLLRGCHQRASVRRNYEEGEWEIEGDHGRIDERKTTVFKGLCDYDKDKFPRVETVIKVERKRTNQISGKMSKEISWYISTRELTAKEASKGVRDHWGIENRANHVLDVTFLEDQSRIRVKPKIMCLIRAFALNILRMNEYENIAQARKSFAYAFEELKDLDHI